MNQPPVPALFRSFFIGGFECSTHLNGSGRRLDLLCSTGHDAFCDADYRRLQSAGIRTVREGIRWHLIERSAYEYDWSSVLPMIRSAKRCQMQVLWDLLHFGWPDGLDIFSAEFVERFAGLSRAFAALLSAEGIDAMHIAPVNEMSYLSWTGAEVGQIHPYLHDRGFELKCQLVRAAIAAIEGAWSVGRARIYHNEPAFNVLPHPDSPGDAEAAEAYRQLQFQAFDMLSGQAMPELGGKREYLDVLGMNYYPWNQWFYAGEKHGGATIKEDDARYRPVHSLLSEWHERYARPIYVAETGREGDKRAPWLNYVCSEVAKAQSQGVPVQGICLYPIVDFPGWEDDRPCNNGLWGYADATGHRPVHSPLLGELHRQIARFEHPPSAAGDVPSVPVGHQRGQAPALPDATSVASSFVKEIS